MLAEPIASQFSAHFSLTRQIAVDIQGPAIAAINAVADRLPTLQPRLQTHAQTPLVKKWDKQSPKSMRHTELANYAFSPDSFSKPGKHLKPASPTNMSAISTFAPRTTVTTSTFFYFMLFLRSLSHPEPAQLPIPQMNPDIHTLPVDPKRLLRPRIKSSA